MSREKLRNNLINGVPYTPENIQSMGGSDRQVLADLSQGVEESCLAVHAAMYEGLEQGDPRVIVFTDDPTEPEKYVSFKDQYGEPCFSTFVEGNPATDIGVRGANPDFEGVLNPTTVVHADRQAVDDYRERGAPEELLEALQAVRLFNAFIIDKVAIPYLREVAEAFKMDVDEYIDHFFPSDQRANTLTRVIQYHLSAREGMRPVGEQDGLPLLIKAHSDKSSFTIDSVQSSSGLQYWDSEAREWVNAGTEVACFKGAAEGFLPHDIPATPHRVVFEEDLPQKASEKLKKVGIGRIAVPTFVAVTR